MTPPVNSNHGMTAGKRDGVLRDELSMASISRVVRDEKSRGRQTFRSWRRDRSGQTRRGTEHNTWGSGDVRSLHPAYPRSHDVQPLMLSSQRNHTSPVDRFLSARRVPDRGGWSQATVKASLTAWKPGEHKVSEKGQKIPPIGTLHRGQQQGAPCRIDGRVGVDVRTDL